MAKSSLNQFLEEKTEYKSERNRTVNIPESVHSFYKNVSNNFDISMVSLVYNVLTDWQDNYKDEIREEIIKRIKKQGF